MKPRRLIAFMNAYSSGRNGGDVVFAETVKRLKKMDTVVITSRLGKRFCLANGLKGSFYLTSTESEFDNVWVIYLKRVIRALLLKIDVQPSDLILGSSDYFPDVFPILKLKLTFPQTPWIQYVHHLILDWRKRPGNLAVNIVNYFFQRLSLYAIRRFSDKIVVVNSLVKKALVDRGFEAKKIAVIPNGLTLSYFFNIKPHEKNRFQAVFLGRIQPSKGILELIHIWKIVTREKPEAKLAIIGKGETHFLKQVGGEIARQGLSERTTLFGYLNDTEAYATIRASRVFVFPSLEEGFGMAPLEAQALGLPVVAWDLPIYTEVFPGGLIAVPRRKIKEFARKILVLLDDDDLYSKISADALKNAKRYNWDVTAQKLESEIHRAP